MKENTRQKLIDTTFEEVFSHGFQGASLSEILKKASVHKGSMYHYFKSKKEMALVAIYEKIHNKFIDRYGGIINQDSNNIDTLILTLKDTSLRDFKRGCPIANVVQEMSNIDEDFNNLMKKIYNEFRECFKKILDKSVDKKELKDCNTKKVALYMTAVLEGAILAAKASGEVQDYLDIINTLEEYINTLKA